MKKQIQLWIALLCFSLILGACQSTPEETPLEETPLQERAEITTAYPLDEEVPVQNPPEMDAAYPVTEEDLELLFRTWNLSDYSEDGVAQDPMVKSLRFESDGSYEMTTESGTTTGNWTAQLFAMESTLILNSDSGETLALEIVDLEESLLTLQSWRENVQITEQFQPAD